MSGVVDGAVAGDRLASDRFYTEVDRLMRLVGAERLGREDVFFRISRADIACDVDYSELQRVLAEIHGFDDWYGGWARSAERFERLGLEAAERGRGVTAGAHLRRAALLYHFAQLFTRPEDPRRAEGRRRRVQCFRAACRHIAPAIEPVEIAYGDLMLPGYLQLPRTAPPHPVVLMLPGANSVKEELWHWAHALTERGLATLSIDGPGQGELSGVTPLRFETYPSAASAALQWIERRPELVADSVAVWGQSTGGQLAIRAAAADARFRAAVSLSGPYDFRRELTTLTPADVREEARDLHGFRTFAETVDYVRAHGSLSGLLSTLECPLLLVHGERDELVANDEPELIKAEAGGTVEILAYADGNHGVCNFNTEMTADMADWLAAVLGAERPDTTEALGITTGGSHA
jgi:2,6-dihydroxypseudooxynicotine hydrolase